MPQPTATIVIPCFNHGRFVGEAVASCLAQVDAAVRVVVVNDGSTDEATAEQCEAQRGERVEVIHQENRGLPAARNRGAERASGEYIAFLDADDWLEPTFVSRLAGAIEEADDERISHAYCQERLTEMAEGVWRVPAWDSELMLITNLHPVTALVRRACFEALGGFDEAMTLGYEDWEFWIRCVERGWRGERVREPLFVWRRHSAVTMVMEAVQRHDDLLAYIVDKHRGLYAERANALFLRCNSMLRQFDCNWLDESGEPHSIRHYRLMAAEWPAVQEQLEAARQHVKVLLEDRQTWENHAHYWKDAHDRLHADYERMTVIRLHHRAHALMRALPGPVRWALELPVRAGRRLAGGDSHRDGAG